MSILILVVLLNLQVIACAVPYNATIGPYNVSFDTGFSDYYISISEPWTATETLRAAKNLSAVE
jgi:hypothetical protein